MTTIRSFGVTERAGWLPYWRALVVCATATLLLACGGGSGGSDGTAPPVAPPPVPARSGAATIGAAGGELEAVLEGGTRVRLEVPPQALAEDVDFRIDPEPAPTGTEGRFRIKPAGVVLRQPVTLIVTLPASAGAPDPDLSLVVVAGGERIPVGGRPDPATRTLRAVLHHLGAPSDGAGPLAAGRKRALSQPRARAEEEEDPAVIAELVKVNYQQQLDVLTQVVTVLTQQQGTKDNAIVAQAAFESILNFAGGDSDARVRTLAEAWRDFVCIQRSFAISEFERYDGVAVNVIERLVRDALIWGQLALQMRLVVAQLVPPLAGCAGAPDDYTQPVQARVPAVLENIRRALALLDSFDFDQMLDARLPELFRLERVLQLYGVNASAQPLIGEQAARLRHWAYQTCRDVGPFAEQRRQARLLDLEAGGDPALAAASPYAEADLHRDIQLCGMHVSFQLRDAQGNVRDGAGLGGFWGVDRSEREIELVDIYVLRLEGVRTQRLLCPSGALNDERLVIAAGPAGGPLTPVRTLAPADAEYLPRNPDGSLQGLDIAISELRPLLQSGDSLAGGQIVIRREGGLCNGEFVNLEAHERLVRLVVADAKPLTVSLDVPSPLRGPTPIGVAVLDATRNEPLAGAQVSLVVDGGSASGGTTNADGVLRTTLTPSFEKPVVTVRAEAAGPGGRRGSATISVAAALPLAWVGTIAVEQIETMTFSIAEPGDGANFFGSLRTGSVEGRLGVTASVEIDLDRFGQRRALRVLGVAGNGSLKTTEHSETEFLGDPGTVNECRVVRHLGGAVDLPGTTQASAAGLGLQLNSDGTYVLDFGGFGSAILGSGPAAVRSYDFYRRAQGEDRACASWLLGGIDGTTTQNRSIGVLATNAPEMAGRVRQGELAGTASRVIDLTFPEQGQGGSRTVTVTWSLRPK